MWQRYQNSRKFHTAGSGQCEKQAVMWPAFRFAESALENRGWAAFTSFRTGREGKRTVSGSEAFRVGKNQSQSFGWWQWQNHCVAYDGRVQYGRQTAWKIQKQISDGGQGVAKNGGKADKWRNGTLRKTETVSLTGYFQKQFTKRSKL